MAKLEIAISIIKQKMAHLGLSQDYISRKDTQKNILIAANVLIKEHPDFPTHEDLFYLMQPFSELHH